MRGSERRPRDRAQGCAKRRELWCAAVVEGRFRREALSPRVDAHIEAMDEALGERRPRRRPVGPAILPHRPRASTVPASGYTLAHRLVEEALVHPDEVIACPPRAPKLVAPHASPLLSTQLTPTKRVRCPRESPPPRVVIPLMAATALRIPG
jgi:hypothetical protein